MGVVIMTGNEIIMIELFSRHGRVELHRDFVDEGMTQDQIVEVIRGWEDRGTVWAEVHLDGSKDFGWIEGSCGHLRVVAFLPYPLAQVIDLTPGGSIRHVRDV